MRQNRKPESSDRERERKKEIVFNWWAKKQQVTMKIWMLWWKERER